MEINPTMPTVFKGVIRPKHYTKFCRFLGNSSQTIRSYMTSLKAFKIFINKDIYQVTKKDVFDYHVYLEVQTSEFKLAASTARLRWYALNKFFKLAMAENWIRYNPMVEVEKISSNLKLPSAINDIELPLVDGKSFNREIINKAIELSEDQRLTIIIKLLSRTGARVSEVLGLKWGHVITFGNDVIYTFLGKGKRIRDVKDFDGKQLFEEMKLVFSPERTNRDDFIFINEKGRVFKYSALYMRIRCLFEKNFSTDRPVSPHKFRHFLITYLLNEVKLPLKTVQKIVGHRFSMTTIRYDHPPEIKYNVGV